MRWLYEAVRGGKSGHCPHFLFARSNTEKGALDAYPGHSKTAPGNRRCRVHFLLSIVLLAVGCMVRHAVDESTVFQEIATKVHVDPATTSFPGRPAFSGREAGWLLFPEPHPALCNRTPAHRLDA